ncbi:uncharacterized protein Z518_05098 [Rhinocladiella mackenziei CBS 650.93]|uniref:Thiopurine S-methyltransferase n=1 Tax=Rhinocladiella mackenziei CBS 650.93 TaxID=1442369 RepID=A0A0D2IVB1_9EURO|nr:uncharacterized protein Z518_05098 [Rhinocladiella mackenziei CBS 650.93]KIX07121.1 hypothetical protein Z518_05098 [Rhinocladiella mackenziei CBS 650.93]
MTEPKPGSSETPGRLISHFQKRDQKNLSDQNAGWSELWDTDQSDLWDRGKPSPALVDFVEQQLHQVLPQKPDGRRLTALVPGCGRGYDVVMLALHSFDAYGLEVSRAAVSAGNTYANAETANPSAQNFSDPEKRPSFEPGNVKFIVGDFFKSDWVRECQHDQSTFDGFDLIYDYTFLCAIPPNMRQAWAQRMQELLSPMGILICLEFPLYKDLDFVGPPWGLKDVYWNLLAEGGTGILRNSDSTGEEKSTQQGPCKRLLYFKPERSYEQGRGTDMISAWRIS